tara:strand:+ start:136 stop:453 length:318 start_codon:yes stop_codon:yes gene_type:complete
MKKMLFMLILILCISSNASAWVVGIGAQTCGEMISDSTDKDYRRWMSIWLQGYVSASNNIYYGSKYADADSIYYETLRICKENPLLHVWAAADKTYNNLKIKKKN